MERSSTRPQVLAEIGHSQIQTGHWHKLHIAGRFQGRKARGAAPG